MPKVELYNDHFQNFKRYNIPKAQLVIADIPYNLANNAYASNPQWYVDGITPREKASLRILNSLTQTKIFALQSFSIFATACCAQSQKKKGKPRQ